MMRQLVETKPGAALGSGIVRWSGIVGGLLLALGLLVGAGQAEASVVLQLSDRQMTQKAARIVRGKVVRKYSQWNKAERRVYTTITIAVLDSLKGSGQPTEVTIRQVGGTANGIGMHVPGTATFKLGEEVFVFLEKRRTFAHHLVMGMAYGKYQVKVDPKTQVRTLHRDLKGLGLARVNESKKMTISEPTAELTKPRRLDSFVQQIKQYLKPVAKSQPRVSPRSVRPSVRVPPQPRVTTPRPAAPQPRNTPKTPR